MANSEIRHIRLGDIIIPTDERNSSGGDYKVMGLNAQKVFMPTVANLETIDLSNYKVVHKGWFAFSGMQTGRDECIRIAIHESDEPILISPAYTTFRLDSSKKVLSEYLFMYFYRSEMDRYGWFISDSSVRANLDWPRFLEIQLPVPFNCNGEPDVQRQHEIVDTWLGFKRMKRQNEELTEPLFQLCRSYLENLKKHYELVEIGSYIEPVDIRNDNGLFGADDVVGLATSKEVIQTKANLEGVNLSTYKTFRPREIAYVADTSRRGDKVSLAMNKTDKTFLISSISVVFRSKDEEVLDSYFLYLWFCRPEFDRYARFHSIGSAREAFDYTEMEKVKIPLPDIDTQRAIVNIYHCAEECRRIAAEADALSQTISPALMQHIIHEHN